MAASCFEHVHKTLASLYAVLQDRYGLEDRSMWLVRAVEKRCSGLKTFWRKLAILRPDFLYELLWRLILILWHLFGYFCFIGDRFCQPRLFRNSESFGVRPRHTYRLFLPLFVFSYFVVTMLYRHLRYTQWISRISSLIYGLSILSTEGNFPPRGRLMNVCYADAQTVPGEVVHVGALGLPI